MVVKQEIKQENLFAAFRFLKPYHGNIGNFRMSETADEFKIMGSAQNYAVSRENRDYLTNF